MYTYFFQIFIYSLHTQSFSCCHSFYTSFPLNSVIRMFRTNNNLILELAGVGYLRKIFSVL